MSTKKLGKQAIQKWVGELIHERRVVAPQAKGNRFAFDEIRSPADLRLDYDVTILPPKKYLMPPKEILLTFTRGGEFHAAPLPQPLVLFGVHPYDVAAIAQMDRYFAQDNVDAHYLERRKNVTIVACDVQNPSEHVFAACMGTATVQDEGIRSRLCEAPSGPLRQSTPDPFDVLLTLVGDAYVAESRTAAGDALLAMNGPLEDADPVSLGRRQQVWDDAQKLLRRENLRCPPDRLGELLDRSFEHPIWREKSSECFSCGSCVMVCPSCFCFDVQDDLAWDMAGGQRQRRWDACLLNDFALVAGGHNFRKQREERYRHRFYRKGKYLPARCGFVGCVGCGRCATNCTAGIADPVEIYNTLLEEQ